jgi:hypothetical protein
MERKVRQDVNAAKQHDRVWHYWELMVLLALQDGFASGTRCARFRALLRQAAYPLAPQSWEGLRLEFCELLGKSIDAGAEPAKAGAEYAPRLTDLDRVLALGCRTGTL